MMMTMVRMMLKMTMIMHLPMMMLASLPVVFILILLHLASNRSFSVRKILQTIIVWPPKYLDIVIVSHLTPSCPLRGISTQELLLYVRPNTIKDYFLRFLHIIYHCMAAQNLFFTTVFLSEQSGGNFKSSISFP